MTLSSSSLSTSRVSHSMLYTFKVGQRLFRRTNVHHALTYQQQNYKHLPGSIVSFGSLGSVEKPFVMNIEAHDSLAEILLNTIDFETVSLQVQSVQSSSIASGPGEQAEPLWFGSIVSITMDEKTCVLEGESLLSQWREEPYPSLRFQTQCAHRLYDENCTVDEDAVRVETVITRISGVHIDVRDIARLGDGWLNGGVVTLSSGEQRTITHHEGNTLVIAFPLKNAIEGVSVSLLPGCDHTAETCLGKYNNLRRYGGFVTLPLNNPFNDGIQ